MIKWVREEIVRAIHFEQIKEHGGLGGLRDESLLQSALLRPQNLNLYSKVDIADLATAYASGIIQNHPFQDGNKRTALVTLELFLMLNGYQLLADDKSCVLITLQLASNAIDESDMANWIRQNIQKVNKS